ncbi:MAG: DNA topoisomerase VI subunit B [Candidatus Micrarchaeota archaeon]|nr:DNA topoisomerase VI subunit B [Candidatus Micrarchaeota archaeon]
MATSKADTMFKEFKEHSVAEFFKKNRQMLGYSSLGRSLVTVVHEYVTNSLDACEEAEILPDITVAITKVDEKRYKVRVQDNGPGIPKAYIGKALATILAGTKFHRYIQQRGQQGIGAGGCALFSRVTTGKPIHAISSTGNSAFSCDVSIETVHNKPIVTNQEQIEKPGFKGLSVEGEFADTKYEMGEHSVYEYLRRTALTNPHAQIKLIDPDGKEYLFARAAENLPPKPQATKPHPLGLTVNDLLEFAHHSESRKISSFLIETFARTTQGKVAELKEVLRDVDLDKDPKEMSWSDAEKMIEAFKQIKWIAPEAIAIIPVGEKQIEVALRNILNPEHMSVVERKPKVFRGGVPFVVEAAVAFGGNSGRKDENGETGYAGNILRFANKVPLLFDSGNCAITAAVRDIQWRRYNIDLDSQPISIMVNVSSVHIPYSGVGKESIAQEAEIIEEVKLAVMDAARGIQRYIANKERIHHEANRYNTIMRYTKQLSSDIADLTGESEEKVEKKLTKLVAEHFPKATEEEEAEEGPGETKEDAEEEEE